MKKLENTALSQDYILHPTVLFIGNNIIVDNKTDAPFTELQNAIKLLRLTVHNAYLADKVVVAKVETSSTPAEMLEKGFKLYPVKFFLSLPQSEIIHKLILQAMHWIEWDLTVQYCGQCGNKLRTIADLNEKKCDTCGLSFFPKFSPAVMVLIKKENQILLARSEHFRPNVYSTIAGFIDAGETAEEAVLREVKEEVGLEITDLEYFGTQTWPFPDRFMIAFKARYLGGDIQIDTKELEDAKWFTVDRLPELPYSGSISRRLIDSCLSDILKN
jgi:NADH pyrophosphatase NudC (nudix superfamily)